MKMRAFYKILPLFYKKLSIVIYKKLNTLIQRFIKNSIFGKNIHPCFSFQSADSNSLQSIGFALPELASLCFTSPSLASTASPSAFAKLLVSTSLWSVFQEKMRLSSNQQVGLLMGVSSLLGFLGSVAFPLLRAKLGTPFTALIGWIAFLSPCSRIVNRVTTIFL